MLDRALLALLADGRFHSGVALGEALGVTRAAVWKRLQGLKALGLELEQVKGRGYRLPHALELLDESVLRSRLSEPLELELAEVLTSTNDRGLEAARSGPTQPLAVLAEHQTAGRGRLGRRWQSPFGSNLYLSLVWPLPAGTRLQGLSLVVGVLLAELLAERGVSQVGIKWPNDIYVGRRKLAGILVELAGNLESDPVAVIGVGVNGYLGQELAASIDQPVTDWLTLTGEPLERNRLAADLLAALQAELPRFVAQGFAAFRKRWQPYDLCCGQPLWLQQGSRCEAVDACGVDADGGLLVEAADGSRRSLYGGEVSIRWR